VDDRKATWAVVASGAVFAVCCAAPLIAIALGAAGTAAWFVGAPYALIAISLIGLGFGGVWHYRARLARSLHDSPPELDREKDS
jgi:mercuric ion transport protein